MRNVAIPTALRNVKECNRHLAKMARPRHLTRPDDKATQLHATRAHVWRSLWLCLNTSGGRS